MARPRKREPPQTAEQWDESHRAGLKSDEAAACYDALVLELERAGQLNAATRSLAKDAAAQEDIILTCQRDIRTRGPVEQMENGAQRLRIENRSIRALARAQQRKTEILTALGLLPGRPKRGRPPKEDAGDDSDASDAWEAFDAPDGGGLDGAD